MSVSLISDASEGNESQSRFQIAGMPLWAIAFLILTAAVSLAISYYRLMYGDDLLEVWCDRVASIGQLAHIQRTAKTPQLKRKLGQVTAGFRVMNG